MDMGPWCPGPSVGGGGMVRGPQKSPPPMRLATGAVPGGGVRGTTNWPPVKAMCREQQLESLISREDGQWEGGETPSPESAHNPMS